MTGMEDTSKIWQYLSGNLDKMKEQEVRNRIKSDKEFAQNVIRIKSVWHSVNESLSELNSDLISDYIHGRLSDEDERIVEEFLKESGDLEFYRTMKSPGIYMNKEGKIIYKGSDKELSLIISKLNEEEYHPRLYGQVKEYAEERPVFMGVRGLTPVCKIISPENEQIITEPVIEFTFECKKESHIRGYIINIYNNRESLEKQIRLEGSRTQVDLKDFKPGHYFWKFSTPTNDLLEVRVFHLLYK